jgi:hypothetical protein
MQRPIGVTLLALGAGLAGLFQVWRVLVFLGIAKWTFIGEEVSFQQAQWGQAIWAAILAAIWFWVATGFWNVRAYAWSFGNFISLFTIIFGFFAILSGTATTESEMIAYLLSIGIFFYLNYPGVRNQFMEHEMSLLTPEQRAAVEAAERANIAAQQAMATPAPAPSAAPAAAAAPPAPAAPPSPPPSSTDAPG